MRPEEGADLSLERNRCQIVAGYRPAHLKVRTPERLATPIERAASRALFNLAQTLGQPNGIRKSPIKDSLA